LLQGELPNVDRLFSRNTLLLSQVITEPGGDLTDPFLNRAAASRSELRSEKQINAAGSFYIGVLEATLTSFIRRKQEQNRGQSIVWTSEILKDLQTDLDTAYDFVRGIKDGYYDRVGKPVIHNSEAFQTPVITVELLEVDSTKNRHGGKSEFVSWAGAARNLPVSLEDGSDSINLGEWERIDEISELDVNLDAIRYGVTRLEPIDSSKGF